MPGKEGGGNKVSREKPDDEGGRLMGGCWRMKQKYAERIKEGKWIPVSFSSILGFFFFFFGSVFAWFWYQGNADIVE